MEAAGHERKVNASMLLWGILFSSIGLGYFVYGKKQSSMIPLLSGLLLMVVPYFISGTLLLVLVGAALVAAPWFIKI